MDPGDVRMTGDAPADVELEVFADGVAQEALHLGADRESRFPVNRHGSGR